MSAQLGARTQAIIVLAMVATLGALLGILGDRLLTQRNTMEVPAAGPGMMGGPPRGGPPPGRGMQGGNQLRYAEWLGDVLELTREQRATIDSLVVAGAEEVRALRQEMEPKLREVARQTRVSIDQVLTTEQRQQLRALRQERLRALRPNQPRRGG